MNQSPWEFFVGSNEVKLSNWLPGKHRGLVDTGGGCPAVRAAVPSHVRVDSVLEAS